MTAEPAVANQVDQEHRPLNDEERAEIRARFAQRITEDGKPVDNIFSERQMRLLSDSLYASWRGPGEGRPFVAMANVGLFYGIHKPPVVPDVLVSLDVRLPSEIWPKHYRSYLVWEYEKAPDVVVEIVSNTTGGELDEKLKLYALVDVPYYVVYDPALLLKRKALLVFEKLRREYVERPDALMPDVGLGLWVQPGVYQDMEAPWLRWMDAEGQILLTGAERAEVERERAERLAAKLRELGLDPEAL
jgi:Uma2 family endonuclease